ncbi:MAG TPA: hypothetical protein VIB39_05090 [Candidatus Angelobacter sp.]|jgi:hypothetical protein
MILLIASTPGTANAIGPPALYHPNQNQAEQNIVVPDGTPIQLRFAQDVWGQAVKKSPLPGQVPGQVQPGDTVHLVSVADVRIGAHIVITKGALAQATIVDVVAPLMSSGQKASETGLFLRLDWIKSINGIEIPLRAFKTGGSGRFHVKVVPDGQGTKVLPDKITPFLSRMATPDPEANADRHTSRHNPPKPDDPKSWIPAGTTIASFIQGAIMLNTAEVEQAQALRPKMNSGALLSIYRGQDHKSDRRSISCDGQEQMQIGERQYVVVALAAGEHKCQMDKEEPVSFTARDGDEIFAHLHPRPLGGGWTLKLVSTAEGEAGVSAAQLVPNTTPQ